MSVGENGSPCRGAWAFCGSVYVHLCVVAGQYMIVLVMRGPERGKIRIPHHGATPVGTVCNVDNRRVDRMVRRRGMSNVMQLSVWVQA